MPYPLGVIICGPARICTWDFMLIRHALLLLSYRPRLVDMGYFYML